MDFIDIIRDLSARIQKQASGIQTEEATKNAFVMPFIGALGYNVFDPTEVTPELNADMGIKKGEKVDYAILMNGKPIILFECKWCGSDLDKEHASQLYRYFSVTECRFGVLTNGIIYRFYSDLEKPNVMDEKPFLEFNMLDIKPLLVEELKKFSKSTFDLNSILAGASDLKYMKEVRKIIEEQINNPSDDFVKFFTSQVYSGRLTQSIREQFAQITKKTFAQYINDKINDRLNIALTTETPIGLETQPIGANGQSIQENIEDANESKIETTDEEFEAYYIIKTILRDAIDSKRVNIRDAINYCAIVLDRSPRKPVARLYFNSAQKYLALIDEEKNEEKIPINSVDDIYNYGDRLKAIAVTYDQTTPRELTGKSLKSFTFKGKKYETTYWKDMLLQLCSAIAESNKDKFDEILTIVGRQSQKPFFSKNPADLRSANLINGTDIYAEVNINPDSVIRLSKNVLSKFGYQESDISIETQ